MVDVDVYIKHNYIGGGFIKETTFNIHYFAF